MTINDTQPPENSSQTGVEAGASTGGVGASETMARQLRDALEQSLTEFLSKQIGIVNSLSENLDKLSSTTQDITKHMDIGADEAQHQAVVRHSDGVSNQYDFRATVANKQLAVLDQITSMGLAAAQVASNVAMFNAVSDAHQEGAHNWDTRCAAPKSKSNA